jgi:hypothetical protein
MVVRIRLSLGPAARRASGLNRQTALVMSSLMTPVALMAWVLGGWRLAADLKWTGAFVFTDGVFSHWQVWFAAAILVQFAAFLLQRRAGGDNDNDTALS